MRFGKLPFLPRTHQPRLDGALGLTALYRGDRASAIGLHREALELARAVGDRLSASIALGNLGNALLLDGRRVEALESFQEALELSREVNDQEGIANCLEGLAGVTAPTRPQRAAHLLGVAEALREAIGIPLPDVDREQLLVHLEPARESLGADAFARAVAIGRLMTLDQVIGGQALAGPPTGRPEASPGTARPREE